jgi:hypothetical protein
VNDCDLLVARQRLGTIRLGPQVDLILPARADIVAVVTPGQTLQAGTSIVGVHVAPDREHSGQLPASPE